MKEIIAGVSSPEDIFEIKRWMQEQYATDQSILPTRVVSMDVEEIRVTHYDWMKMMGEIPMTTKSELLKTTLAKDRISGFNDDKWKQLPSIIMIGNVHEIEQFNSEVSGINPEMAGFIDLSALALIAWYQMNARGMTPMGVQVLGAVLNKCVSTGDNKWG